MKGAYVVKGHAWQKGVACMTGAYLAGGMLGEGGVHGKVFCVAKGRVHGKKEGVHDKKGSVHGKKGVCMARCCVWQRGVCMVKRGCA